MLGLQTDFRPPRDYSDAGWRFYTSSNERGKKENEKKGKEREKKGKERGIGGKEERKNTTYTYIYIRLASSTYPRGKSVGYPFWFTSSTTVLAVPRLVVPKTSL